MTGQAVAERPFTRDASILIVEAPHVSLLDVCCGKFRHGYRFFDRGGGNDRWDAGTALKARFREC
jgi:hypothetical protein